MEHPADFETWFTEAAQVRSLWNPLRVARWNLRKTYLRQLESQGIPIVPTEWIGESTDDLTRILDRTVWRDFVVKPTLSAGSFRTLRFTAGERTEANEFISRTGEVAHWMVQPYLPAVEDHGERAIVVIEGRAQVLRDHRGARGWRRRTHSRTTSGGPERSIPRGGRGCQRGRRPMRPARSRSRLPSVAGLSPPGPSSATEPDGPSSLPVPLVETPRVG